VRASGIFGRHRILRWIAPAGVLAAGGALGLTMLSPASADSRLSPMSADQLLSAVSSAQIPGLSGTVTENASLGLPMLGSSTDSVEGLLTGSHSLRVWYAGTDQQRVAMVDKSGEYDVFRNGVDVWQWDSTKQEATHAVLPRAATDTPTPSGTTDPQTLAQEVLAAVGSTTTISIGPQQKVAGREAYQLVLTPKQTGSRISSVTMSVDGQTHIPLGVQVYGPSKADGPAIDVSYLDVDLAVPDASMFTFTPPQSAKVTEQSAVPTGVLGQVKTIGTGWTTVLELPDASSLLTGPAAIAEKLLPAVQGTWGSGYVYNSKLLSALITEDGRLFVGAVDPSVLYAAAATSN
jgi:outer membrane lipoprotein-sorting protein